jgi:hypothetical protein
MANTAPKSVFQLAGGGHPGTGAIRGMPILDRLVDAGFRIWPFHAPEAGRPLVVEIYPRLLTGELVKKDQTAREQHLRKYEARIPTLLSQLAAGDEDQFDAAISAAVMNRYLNELVGLEAGDEVARLEGRIWWPADPDFVPEDGLPDFLDPRIPGETFGIRYLDPNQVFDAPFHPKQTQVMDWEGVGPDGTVGIETAGVPLHLRVLERRQGRLFTADGDWLELVPASDFDRD